MTDALIHLRVPAELKGRWVRESRATGLRLTDWIVSKVEEKKMYNMDWIMDRLGPVADIEDAEQALEAAEEWHNSTPKAEMIDWYNRFRGANGHAPALEEDGELVSNWNEIVIHYRAVSGE